MKMIILVNWKKKSKHHGLKGMNTRLVNIGIELMVNLKGSYLPQKEKAYRAGLG